MEFYASLAVRALVHFQAVDQTVFIIVSGPKDDIHSDVIAFATRLIVAFALLGLVFASLLLWQLKKCFIR